MNVTAKGLPVHEIERDRDALERACDVQHRAGLVGFDWSEPGGALEKVREETDEVAALIGPAGMAGREVGAGVEGGGRKEVETSKEVEDTREEEKLTGRRGPGAGGDRREVAEELGDLLFAVVNLARLAGVDPVAALSRATDKFEGRFAEVRRLARERGLPMPGTPLGPLDRLWDEVKAWEGRRGKP